MRLVSPLCNLYLLKTYYVHDTILSLGQDILDAQQGSIYEKKKKPTKSSLQLNCQNDKAQRSKAICLELHSTWKAGIPSKHSVESLGEP